jgi:hypothetical protein
LGLLDRNIIQVIPSWKKEETVNISNASTLLFPEESSMLEQKHIYAQKHVGFANIHYCCGRAITHKTWE